MSEKSSAILSTLGIVVAFFALLAGMLYAGKNIIDSRKKEFPPKEFTKLLNHPGDYGCPPRHHKQFQIDVVEKKKKTRHYVLHETPVRVIKGKTHFTRLTTWGTEKMTTKGSVYIGVECVK